MRQLRFTRLIGSGSFGKVYQAELLTGQDFRRTVAVKFLIRPGGDDALFTGRVRDEARLLGLLEHENLLKVQELLHVAGRDAVLMELVDGTDLAALIDAGHRPGPRALAEIGAAVAAALAHAHTALHPTTREPMHVIHRDVKPANVMVTARGGVKLLDFGVAKAAFDARESSTGAFVLGTLNYMAPEYVITATVSTAADIYGLALTLWEASTGEPFGTPKFTEDAHKARVNERLSRIEADHGALTAVLKQMFAWSPESRPDAAEAEQALLRAADTLPGPGLRAWASEAVPATQAARPPLPDDDLGIVGGTYPVDSPSPTPLPAAPAPVAPIAPVAPFAPSPPPAPPVVPEPVPAAPPVAYPVPPPPPPLPPRDPDRASRSDAHPRPRRASAGWMVLQGILLGISLGFLLLLVGLVVYLLTPGNSLP